jgi:hypothetical protein
MDSTSTLFLILIIVLLLFLFVSYFSKKQELDIKPTKVKHINQEDKLYKVKGKLKGKTIKTILSKKRSLAFFYDMKKFKVDVRFIQYRDTFAFENFIFF